MTLIGEIHRSWGWIGLDPVEVVGENDFGNLIIRDFSGSYWRLCPEACTCEVVAANRQELDELTVCQEFSHDWYMRALVELASEHCGPLSDGRKYCLKIPAVLGGSYEADNLATVPLLDLVSFSGEIANKTHDLPNGARVKLKVVD